MIEITQKGEKYAKVCQVCKNLKIHFNKNTQESKSVGRNVHKKKKKK